MTKPPLRHVTEMTVREQEAFEKAHGITVAWSKLTARRRDAENIDRRAMAARKRKEQTA